MRRDEVVALAAKNERLVMLRQHAHDIQRYLDDYENTPRSSRAVSIDEDRRMFWKEWQVDNARAELKRINIEIAALENLS